MVMVGNGSRLLFKKTITVKSRKRPFFFRPTSRGDRGVIRQIFKNQDYSLTFFRLAPKLANYYSKCIASGRMPLIIDAGANIGASSVYFSLHYPNAAIVAIEPERNNCELLRRNCSDIEHVRVLEAALGGESCHMRLQDPCGCDAGFRIATEGAYEIEVLTVAQIIRDYPASSHAPFICKIDIEGSEKLLFETNTEWVQHFPLLIIELHDWMLPGEANSRNFLKTVSQLNVDFLYRGENVFCFNNELLQ
jgi:FkbM family methyltransferase